MFKSLRHKDRGHWIIAAALSFLVVFLVTIFLVYSIVYQSVYHDYATSERHAAAQEAFERECAKLPTVKEAAECFEELIRGHGEAQRAQEDLYAQKQMADWAFAMLIVTGAVGVGTIGVAAYGAYWVWRTFLATQGMALDTRRIGESQARAYLSAGDAEISWPNKQGPIVFRCGIFNNGATPSRRISVRHRVGTCNPNILKVRMRNAKRESFFDISPSDFHFLEHEIHADAKARGMIMSGLITVYWAGVITYHDVFRKKRRATFHLYLRHEELTASKDGSAIRLVGGKHNRSS